MHTHAHRHIDTQRPSDMHRNRDMGIMVVTSNYPKGKTLVTENFKNHCNLLLLLSLTIFKCQCPFKNLISLSLLNLELSSLPSLLLPPSSKYL